MKLVAAVTINNYSAAHMDEDQIKDYVLHSLTREISNEVTKYMQIEETKDHVSDTTRYSGTLTITPTGTSIGSVGISSTYNGVISGSSYTNYSQINLRVVEYTKNGKVTRVELQKYDEEGDEWFKIPRIQIEE
jgi:hypothetical protein